jgi:hypothetical protein
MHRIWETALMALIVPAFGLVVVLALEFFDRKTVDDIPYPARLCPRARKAKRVRKRWRV